MVAPFSSPSGSVMAVCHSFREGRSTLATAFAAFAYMILFSGIFVGLKAIHSARLLDISEACWLLVNAVYLQFFVYSLARATPLSILTPHRPTSSLFGPTMLSTVAGIFVIDLIFEQLALPILLEPQAWFECRQYDRTNAPKDIYGPQREYLASNFETGVLFYVVSFQVLWLPLILNQGARFRASWWRNRHLILTTLLLTGLLCVLLLTNRTFIHDFFQLNSDRLPNTIFPDGYGIMVLIYAVVNFICCVLFYDLCVIGWFAKYFRERKRRSKAIPR